MQPQQPQTPLEPQSDKPAYIAPAPEYYVPPEFQRISKDQQPKSHRKFWVIFLIIIGLVIIGGGAVFVYTLLNKPGTNQSAQNTPELKEVAEPTTIIANYIKEPISSRSSLYTQRKEITDGQPTNPVPGAVKVQSPSNGVILYRPSDKYGTAVSVSDRVQYARNDSVKDNDETLESKTASYLEGVGLVKLNQLELGEGSLFVTYDSKNVICQISSMSALGSAPAAYGLACVNKTIITEQYNSIDAVLPLAKDIDMAKITDVTIATTSQEKVKLITLTVSTSEETNTLYFATLGTDWEYLGKRPVTNPDDADSFTLPVDLKNKITDPKWGTFLTNTIH